MRHVRWGHLPLLIGVLSTGALGCGPGAAAETIRPNDPTAANALGEGDCHDVGKGGEPLVVDWKPEQRGDLEIAMQEGVAVVQYSCQGFKLLKDCKVDGKYGFMGMTKKEQVVRLQNADEMRANLPLSGAKLGGELSRGSTIDVAMILVGKKRTTWDKPTKEDLKGSCDGATHYVRGATVGAFVMETGTDAKVKAAVEMFGASAGAGSSSAKQTRNQEGDPSDCGKATPDADKAPSQCGAPVRLVLEPILVPKDPAKQAEAPAEPPGKPAVDVETKCPEGMVYADGKCAKRKDAAAYLCKADDVADCTAQCDKGHPGSCGLLGITYKYGGPGTGRDLAKAAPVLDKGCSGGDTKACVELGDMKMSGAGTAKDAAAAVKLFEKGCSAGEAAGCRFLGIAYTSGSGVGADPAKAASLLTQACDGGDDRGCGEAAVLYADGKGVGKDADKARDYHQRACNGTWAPSCESLGQMKEAQRDLIGAKIFYQRACFRSGAPSACFHYGRLDYEKNAQFAKVAFNRACSMRVDQGCAALKVLYGENRPVMGDPGKKGPLMTSCNAGNNADCATVGLMDLAMGNKVGAAMTLDRACMRRDEWACTLAKKAK